VVEVKLFDVVFATIECEVDISEREQLMDDKAIDAIIALLTPAARKACKGMTTEWTFAGESFNAPGAYALHISRVGSGVNFLCERKEMLPSRSLKQFRPAYRLTPIGERVAKRIRQLEL
jgi:hypothetical protein